MFRRTLRSLAIVSFILFALPIAVFAADAHYSWKQVTPVTDLNPNTNWVASSADGMKLAALGRVGIFTSTDGGATWVKRDAGTLAVWYAIASSADGKKLAVAGLGSEYTDGKFVQTGRIYTSTDGGASWKQRDGAGVGIWNNIFSSTNGMRLIATKVGSSALSISTDGGASWREVDNKFGEGFHSLAASADGVKLIGYIASSKQIVISTTGGLTWSARSVVNTDALAGAVVTISSDGKKLAVAEGKNEGKVYTSTDGGNSWVMRSPFPELRAYWSAIGSSGDGQTIMLTNLGSGALIISKDGGATWTKEISAPASVGGNIFAFSADGKRVAIASGSGYYVGVAPWNGLTWSQNIGAGTGFAWKALSNSELGTDGWSNLAVSADGKRIVMTDARNLYVSVNGGTTWARKSYPELRYQWFNGMQYVMDELPLFVYGFTASGDGQKMAAIAQQGREGNVVYTSKNGGTTWTRSAAPGFTASAITSSADGSTILVWNSGSSISVSIDGGATWKQGVLPGVVQYPVMAISSDGSMMFVGSPLVTGMYASFDFGATWSHKSLSGSVSSIAISTDSTKLVANVAGRLYVSSDAGATWSEKSSSLSGKLGMLAVSGDGLKIATAKSGDFIYVSVDGGATWVQQTGAEQKSWAKVAFSANGSTIVAVPSTRGERVLIASTGSTISLVCPSGTTGAYPNCVAKKPVSTVLPTPTATPAAGTYNAPVSVTLTSAGASSIRYLLGDQTPSCTSGTLYSTPISIQTTQTLKAIACPPAGVASASGLGFFGFIERAIRSMTAAVISAVTPSAGTRASAVGTYVYTIQTSTTTPVGNATSTTFMLTLSSGGAKPTAAPLGRWEKTISGVLPAGSYKVLVQGPDGKTITTGVFNVALPVPASK